MTAKRKTTDPADQVPPTRQTGPESATGAALAAADHEIPQGEDRGSTVPIEGDITPDSEGREAQGAQLEPARYTSNGQLPHNMVPSPSGTVPVGAVATSPEDAQKRVEDVLKAHDEYVAGRNTIKKLDTATIHRLTGAELRAIGEQRGYSMPNNVGTRAMRARFIEAQDKDENIGKKAPAAQPTPTSPQG
jgi:hypothetical protein